MGMHFDAKCFRETKDIWIIRLMQVGKESISQFNEIKFIMQLSVLALLSIC